MFSKSLYLLISGFILIVTIGCESDLNQTLITDNSPVGIWYYDSIVPSENGSVLSMNITFDIRQDSTYIKNSKQTMNTKFVFGIDSGTWVLSGSNFIRNRRSTWMSNIATGEYERITPSRLVDTFQIDLKNELLYQSQNEIYRRR
jgi:hypothetical protein